MIESSRVKAAFDVKKKGMKPLPGYTHEPLMMIFDTKLNLACKARLVLRGDQTENAALVY